MSELLVFAREFVREARATGSFFPTGKLAARALTRPLLERSAPMRVLELGPGTGAVTGAILGRLRAGDILDICEINPRFMGILQKRLDRNADFITHSERVNFHCCPAQELPDAEPYDVVICSLPFLNFDVPTVVEILERLRSLSHESTVMTHYSYHFVQTLAALFAGEGVRERMTAVSQVLDAQGRVGVSQVWWNFPPLTIYAMKPRMRLPATSLAAKDELPATAQTA